MKPISTAPSRGRIALSALIACVLAAQAAPARSAESFYDGRQMTMLVPYGAGGAYDILARLLARHIGNRIAGAPGFVTVNMPGAGGLKAANHFANVAPRDGSVMAIMSQGLPLYQLRDGKGLKTDVRQFNWIGNMSYSNQLMAAWHGSPVKTLDDAKRKEFIIAATGRGAIPAQLAAAYNYLVGTKLKIIWGYRGSQQMYMAMESGEVEGRATNTWAGYRAEKPDWVAQKKLNFLIQVGTKKEPDLPDVPLLADLVRGDGEREGIARVLSLAVMVGRPIAVAPGVPAERVALLRRAFDETMKDPAFLADAKRANSEIRAMTGAELTSLIDDLFATPKPLIAKLNHAIAPREGEFAERRQKN
jgi:tripartite-type tricarboxylate transporter receptor subunit TctC